MPRTTIPKTSFYTHRPVVARSVTISADGRRVTTTNNFFRGASSASVLPQVTHDAPVFEHVPMDLDDPDTQPDIPDGTRECVAGLPSVQVVAKMRAKRYENSVQIFNVCDLKFSNR